MATKLLVEPGERVAETVIERVVRMRIILLLTLLAVAGCAGIPFVGNDTTSQLTEREFSALRSIPGGFAQTARRSSLRGSADLALIRSNQRGGLTAYETTALESVFGAHGRVDQRETVHADIRLSFVDSGRTRQLEMRTLSALDGIPRSAFGF
ncbi:MAG: hypothetical protein O7B81_00460 [Gammaproteobacteria bacterium]|nr:hypothetical protein [Gammaproteobacteria bacterium]